MEFYKEEPETLISYAAILAAFTEFRGIPYSWETGNHHCSGYVALYFKYLGFPVATVTTPVSQYSPAINDPMPDSTTVKQVPYLKMIAENYGTDLTHEIALKEILSNRNVWKKIPPGTVLYLPERIGHHGYDTLYTYHYLHGPRQHARTPVL